MVVYMKSLVIKFSSIVFVLLISLSISFSQNLVPNGSFETVNCQTGFYLPWGNPVENNSPWFSTTGGSTDSYNVCHSASFNMYNVPSNFNGIQTPFEGSGYVGIIAYEGDGQNNYREYISVMLSSPLQAGVQYRVSYYVSLADESQYAAHAPGVYISQSDISDHSTSYTLSMYTPQISTNQVIDDNENWTLVTGFYTANGNEEFITIGNFEDDNDTYLAHINPAGGFDRVYFYIDAVSVIPVELPEANFTVESTDLCEGQCTLLSNLSSDGNISTPITSWDWVVSPTNGAPIIDNVQDPGVVCWNTPGTYDITLTISNGTYSDDTTIQVVVSEEINIELGVDTTICGPNYVLDAGNPGASYLWNDGSTDQTFEASQTGVYYVTVSNGACVETREIHLTFPTIDVNLGQDMILCEDDLDQGLLLNAQNTGSSYVWNTGDTTEQITVNSEGVYSVIVSKNGCMATDEIAVLSQEISTSFVAIDTAGCVDFQADFTNSNVITNGAVTHINWEFGDGSHSTSNNPSHLYTQVGSYDVKVLVTSDIGCQFDTTISNYITVYPTAIADFKVIEGTNLVGDAVQYDNISQYSDSWEWFFVDGVISTEENPTHAYLESGEFSTILIAKNQYGCNDTVHKMVTIQDPVTLFVPNSFSPNGDGNNEEWSFSVLGIDETSFRVSIFNRWGETIWTSTDPNASWDGTHKGIPVQDGSYTWKIICSAFEHAERRMYTGSIHLIK